MYFWPFSNYYLKPVLTTGQDLFAIYLTLSVPKIFLMGTYSMESYFFCLWRCYTIRYYNAYII